VIPLNPSSVRLEREAIYGIKVPETSTPLLAFKVTLDPPQSILLSEKLYLHHAYKARYKAVLIANPVYILSSYRTKRTEAREYGV
jgi:hypothetical protein